MADRKYMDDLTGSSCNAFAVVPHNVDPLAAVPKALYVGTAGNVTLRSVDGAADVAFANVPAGTILPVRATHVRATGTTASNIVAMA